MKSIGASAQEDAWLLVDIEYVRRLERQNRAWKLSRLILLAVFALFLTAGVRAQQNQQDAQTPATDQTLHFVLKGAAGNRLGEWFVNDGNITRTIIPEHGTMKILPIPPLGPATPNERPVDTPTKARFQLRGADGKLLAD